MDNTIRIEPIGNAYCRQVVDLIIPIQQLEFGVPITLEDQPDLLDIESSYHAIGGKFWGALHEGALVGTIALIPVDRHAAVVRKMFVKKEFRGRSLGIAQQLLDTLLQYCATHRITYLYLGTVDMLRAAHRFYERNGFQRIDKSSLPSHYPTMAADNVYYELNLTKQ